MMDEKKPADHNVSSASSRIPADEETRITIRDDEEDLEGAKSGGFDEKSKGLMLNDEELRGSGEDQYSSCADNVKNGKKLERDCQRLCRICHLSRLENDEKDVSDFIELGCSCRGELGFAHSLCAEAWFKVRGNRSCEICGETAKNVSGSSDGRFMEEWNEEGLAAGGAATSSGGRCWQDKPLCNFLMACLVLAFVLPWFFRVNMF